MNLAIIGGTGLNQLPDFTVQTENQIETPYGATSAPLAKGQLAGQAISFLPRHGQGHTLPPHAINYRANIWALREAGITEVVAVAAVGGIRQDMTPGSIAIPDQIIDYSWGRAHSFHEGQTLEHIEFDPPYAPELRQRLIQSAQAQAIPCVADGCYGCTQGPRLETAAEIRRLQADGCDLVGMTGMPEAALAREAGLDYACIAVVVNWAAGLGPGGQGIHDQIEEAIQSGMSKSLSLIQGLISQD